MGEPTAGRRYLTFNSTDFPTEGGWIGDEPDPEKPPGREVIECLSLAVDAGMPLNDIWSEEGYGWAFNCKVIIQSCEIRNVGDRTRGHH